MVFYTNLEGLATAPTVVFVDLVPLSQRSLRRAFDRMRRSYPSADAKLRLSFLRLTDVDLYRDAYDEAQRLIRISDEVRITPERVERKPEPLVATAAPRLAASKVEATARAGWTLLRAFS